MSERTLILEASYVATPAVCTPVAEKNAAAQSTPGAPSRQATNDPLWVRVLCITVALAFIALFLFVPLAIVFPEAFKKGAEVYFASIREPDALAAIRLT